MMKGCQSVVVGVGMEVTIMKKRFVVFLQLLLLLLLLLFGN